VAHGPQKAGDLAAMMGAVVHHVKDNLPERLIPLVLF
jgi:hypothetical protein